MSQAVNVKTCNNFTTTCGISRDADVVECNSLLQYKTPSQSAGYFMLLAGKCMLLLQPGINITQQLLCATKGIPRILQWTGFTGDASRNHPKGSQSPVVWGCKSSSEVQGQSPSKRSGGRISPEAEAKFEIIVTFSCWKFETNTQYKNYSEDSMRRSEFWTS